MSKGPERPQGEKYQRSSGPQGRPDATPPEERRPRITIGGYIEPQIVALPEGVGPMRIQNGRVQIDREALTRETQRVTEWLQNSIREGDERTLEIYLQTIDDRDEGAAELKASLREAFEKKAPDSLRLGALHINVSTGGIAQRNIIREGLRPQLARHPFSFRDRHGNELRAEDELDIVFTMSEHGEPKFVIGSQKGIDRVAFPDEENYPSNKFKIKLDELEKNTTTDAITFTLTESDDREEPSVPIIEVRKGPINVLDELARAEASLPRPPRQDDPPPFPGTPTPYTPPSPRPYSSGSSHVRYSG